MSARKDFLALWKSPGKALRQEVIDEPEPHDATKENNDAIPENKYEYTHLPEDGHYIRILELHAGDKYDPIVCDLKGTNLNETVDQYEALSYVWGEEGTRIAIQVNDGRLEIGSSLHCALRYLRYPDKSRFLWVDAICIDQSSFSERGIQVPLMCEIYRNGTATICFLGPEIKTTGIMFNMLENLAEESKTINYDSFNTPETLPAFVNHLPVHKVNTKLYDEFFADTTIVDIASRSWWFRAWTVQELLLSSNAVLMIGKYTITWENFRAATDHGLNIQIWNHSVLGFIVNPVVVPYISMRALTNRYRLPDQRGTPAVDLLRLLVHCRHRESRDPRDKIYALLGILRDAHSEALKHHSPDAPEIKIEYKTDVREVYCKISKEIIAKTNTLDSLGVRPRTSLDLPSWATDWSVTDRIGSPLTQDSLDRPRKTHATKQSKADASFTSDTSRLILSGFEVTTITALSEVLPAPELENVAGSRMLVQLEKDIDSSMPNVDRFQAWRTQASSPESESVVVTTGSKLHTVLTKTRMHFARSAYTVKSFAINSAANIALWTVIILWIVKIMTKTLVIQYFSFEKDGQCIMSAFHTLFRWEKFVAEQQYTNPGIEPGELYWQTLCCGTYKDSGPAETKRSFEQWYELLEPLRKFVRNFGWVSRTFPWIGIAVYMRATWNTYGDFWPFIGASQHRRLGKLENGWLGVLPGDARVGDIVVLARGGRVPLVVRKEEVEEKERILFVGEAYIHGIMDGEIWDEKKCDEMKIW
ncbi:hypothetical protein ONS96_010704 [Cadophora gregata f. sp. sojae]|nr:hypothetical protein ONS96_010704 [Cadophora gregata f. sp. sojae]